MSVDTTKQTMVSVKETNETLTVLTSTSKVSVWGTLFYIVAAIFQDLQTYFDTHRAYVDEKLHNEKYGTLPWYRTKALAFQYGYDLVTDTDYYDNSTLTEDEVTASQIIKSASVNVSDDGDTLVIKVATDKDGELAQVSEEVEESIEFYFEEIKIAGTEITIINYLADQLYLNMDIYINPLLFDTNGMHVISGEHPVEDAINSFLKELDFDGEFVLQDLEMAIREIEGVDIAEIREAKSAWIDGTSTGYGTPTVIDTKRIPESGYYQVVTFDNISYYVV